MSKELSVSFVLIAEGAADHGLVTPLETLCVLSGADLASGNVVNFSALFSSGRLPESSGRSIAGKLQDAVATGQIHDQINLLFIHRDADDADASSRYREIEAAVHEASLHLPQAVAIVPIQATEAWLLLDEEKIRFAVENPNGKVDLLLPKVSAVESLARPKQIFEETIARANERRRGRPKTLNKSTMGAIRRQLLETLDIEGPITQLSAWQKLQRDTARAIGQLREALS